MRDTGRYDFQIIEARRLDMVACRLGRGCEPVKAIIGSLRTWLLRFAHPVQEGDSQHALAKDFKNVPVDFAVGIRQMRERLIGKRLVS